VLGSLYTKGDLSCSSCFLVEQGDANIFALVASLRSARSKLLLLLNKDVRANASSRTLCYSYCVLHIFVEAR